MSDRREIQYLKVSEDLTLKISVDPYLIEAMHLDVIHGEVVGVIVRQSELSSIPDFGE